MYWVAGIHHMSGQAQKQQTKEIRGMWSACFLKFLDFSWKAMKAWKSSEMYVIRRHKAHGICCWAREDVKPTVVSSVVVVFHAHLAYNRTDSLKQLGNASETLVVSSHMPSDCRVQCRAWYKTRHSVENVSIRMFQDRNTKSFSPIMPSWGSLPLKTYLCCPNM